MISLPASEGRSQLLAYDFMFGPSYEAGCPTCSSMADAVDGVLRTCTPGT
jgi:predicted dithiol-disulfide oxidoreductase (DUF899 family)